MAASNKGRPVSEIPAYYVDGRDSQDLASQDDDGKGYVDT